MSGVAEKCHNFLDNITRHNLPSMIVHTHNISALNEMCVETSFQKIVESATPEH